MKNIIALTAASMIAATPVLAGSPVAAPADPVLAPVAVAAPTTPDWTGFYGGAELGYGNIDTSIAGVDGDGLVGGLIAGYDYDFGTWVLGAGFDYDWTDISIAPGVDIDSVWRAKLRAGAKLGNGLLYATGGYTQADANVGGSEDGYFVGGGYEHMIMQNMSLGAEVLYHDFDVPGTLEATTVQARATYRF
jgi:opacity protein-like surface antigen